MKFAPKNTLAHYNAAPQTKAIDLSHIPTNVLGKATAEYRKTCGEISPDQLAINFYAMNHCASLVRKRFTTNEPMPEWAQQIMRTYTDLLASEGNRVMHYMICIITREMRHLKTSGVTFFKQVTKEYGEEFTAFVQSICSVGEDAAVKAYQTKPLQVGLGQYSKGMAWVFHNGKWNSSYGGPKWGVVADCLASFLNGQTSMEMMVDTAFTLAHNGGPIFNKGMMFMHYSHKFIHILDVQRSGQIPELVMESHSYGIEIPDEAAAICALAKQHMPEDFGPHLDWNKVESLGGKQNYSSEKLKQKELHGENLTSFAFKGGKKIKIIGEYEVFPSQSVQVFQRVKA